MSANELLSKIDKNRLPRHVAIIMDGNGRWAKERGKLRVFGHQNGVKAVREATETCAELGVEYLTLYAFSTENWNRPSFEVNALMSLLVSTTRKELATLTKNNIRLQTIGDFSSLPDATRNELAEAIEATKNNTRMTLVLALSYSSKKEITDAMRNLAIQVKSGTLQPEQITEEHISKALYTHDIPDPELLIRTSGESRISNFLLWQIAYTELYFTPIFWPDFHREEMYKAIIDFQGRERRFGMTSEQVQK